MNSKAHEAKMFWSQESGRFVQIRMEWLKEEQTGIVQAVERCFLQNRQKVELSRMRTNQGKKRLDECFHSVTRQLFHIGKGPLERLNFGAFWAYWTKSGKNWWKKSRDSLLSANTQKIEQK